MSIASSLCTTIHSQLKLAIRLSGNSRTLHKLHGIDEVICG